MGVLNKAFLVISIIALVIGAAMFPMGQGASAGLPLTIGFVALGFFSMGNRVLKSYAFTIWVFASVAASYYYPAAFGVWFGYDLNASIVPLIQIIMFGMGTTLNIGDFIRVAKLPIPILIGIVLQYGLKPIVALMTAKMFGFTGDIAAGVVLIGSVPGGVASNLMTYLASGDVALSVTMTSFSTILSPIFTPLSMKWWAGAFVSVEFWSMFFSIINMIIVPTIAGLIANKILYSKSGWANSKGTITGIAAVSLVVAVIAIGAPGLFVGTLSSIRPGVILSAILMSVVSFAKLVVSLIMNGSDRWMDKVLPLVSMFGIVMIIAVITSRSTEQLASAGLALLVCSIIQITVGFVTGYWLSRALGQSEKTSRTVSIEVGLQNGGMASALAMNVLQSAQAALASVVYGPLMNVMGSIVATYWHRKPVKEKGAK